ncbi:MAG: hypothetical protein LBQ24_01455 [Candidatus Peribacteria bacterium]|jgi:hypothetical protein|nr:hypothetical protein [Candidatus Peribacteria bacterium]
MVNRPAESPTAKNSYTKKEIEFFQELINKNTPLTKEELGELKKIINRVNPLTTENIKYLLDRI